MRRWWPRLRRETQPPVPYEVHCACGHPLIGRRRRHHQVVACPVCRRPVFVLPRSPWPAPQRSAVIRKDMVPGTTPAARRSPFPWRMPVLAGVVCATAVLIVYLAVLPSLSRRAPEAESAAPEDRATAEINRRIAAGEQRLTEGSFTLARDEFHAALALGEERPDLLAADRRRALIQMQRQTDLLARLLDLPLEDVVHQGALVRNPSEWQARFDKIYRGKTVIFDDVVRRDAAGQPTLASYVVEGPATEVRVALENLKLLDGLPLEPPQHLLFGARLASCARAAGGSWVIRFEPDSTVLLTDRLAAEACCPLPLGPDLLEVLEHQKAWLRDAPAQPPAP